MSAVRDLLPGQIVAAPFGRRAVFVARTEHPIWPHLELVVWCLDDGSWSHDALDPNQDVGHPDTPDRSERMQRLRAALLGSRNIAR